MTTPITKFEVGQILERLWRVYGVPEKHRGIEREITELYWQELQAYPPDAVSAAAATYIRTTPRYFPSVARLLELVRDRCPRPLAGSHEADDGPRCGCGRAYEWLEFERSDGSRFVRLECARHYAGGHPIYGSRRTRLVGPAPPRPGEAIGSH